MRIDSLISLPKAVIPAKAEWVEVDEAYVPQNVL